MEFMKCPNCGAEIREGSLYCEHCGEDIHIVPDFEPEVEFSLEQTLSGIVEELGDSKSEKIAEPEENASGKQNKEHGRKRAKRRKKKLALLIGGCVFLGLLISAAVCLLQFTGTILLIIRYKGRYNVWRADNTIRRWVITAGLFRWTKTTLS